MRSTRASAPKRSVREWRADAAIVTEPTDLAIAVAHKGFAWLEIVTHGRAAHGSRPADGRDAILRMGRVLVALEALRPRASQPGRPVRSRARARCMRRSSPAGAS